jgi:Mrp family chromosome partitioning ATPase/capsular polysaccharide biosynthesis protein
MTNDPRSANEPGNIQDYVRPVLLRKWWILAAVVLATAGTYLYSASRPDEYSATTSLYLQTQLSSNPMSTASTMPPTDRNASNQAELVTARGVLEAAAERIGDGTTYATVAGGVSATATDGSDFIRVTGTSSNPTLAARMANATAREFVKARAARLRGNTEQAIATTRAELNALPSELDRDDPRFARQQALANRLSQLRDLLALPTNDITITSFASPPSSPSAPRPLRDALFALVLALVAALGLAFAFDRFDRRIKTVDDAVDAFGLPLLAVVPEVADPAPVDEQRAALGSASREAFRGLLTNLKLASLDRPMKTIVVTSGVSGEGKSTVVRNMAIAYREWGLRVAVVDMDLRRPTLSSMLNVEHEGGLLELLSGERTFEESFAQVPVKADGLQVLARIESRAATNGNGNGAGHVALDERADGVFLLPAGARPSNPEAVLATRQVESVLEQLADEFDVVLIDTAPLLAVTDSVPVARLADGVVVVTRVGYTTSDQAGQLAAQLDRIPGANVLGIVVNGLSKREGRYGSYGYYGRYGGEAN